MRSLFGDILTNGLNPVMVRDLYRGFQNSILMSLLILFSICNMALVCGVIFMPDSFIKFLFSLEIWQLLMLFAYAVCGFLLPLFFSISAARDKLCRANLFRMTFLSPFQVIRGQLLADMTLVLLFVVFLLPFGLFCFFNGGLDMTCMAGELGVLLAVVWVNILVGLTLVSIGRSWTATIPFIVITAFITACTSLGGAMYGYGFFTEMIRHISWEHLSLLIIIFIGLSGMLYISAATALSVPDANRALPLRLYLTAVILIWGAMAWYVAVYKFEADQLLTWMEASWLIIAGLCLCTACERTESTPRIRRMIPQLRVLRWPCYCLYSGASNGLCWCAFLGAGLAHLWNTFNRTMPLWKEQLLVFSNQLELYYTCYIACFIFSLAVTVILIRYVVFHDWYPRLWNFPIIIALAVIMHFVVGYLSHRYCAGHKLESIYSHAWLVLSPYELMKQLSADKTGKLLREPLVIYGTWAIFVNLLLAPWHFHQMQKFKPLHNPN